MSNPHKQGESNPRITQFDRAEFAQEGAHGTFCRECRRPIRDEYYDVNGNVVCSTCHANRSRLRSRSFRTLKAVLLGSLAAGVGAGIYRMIILGTGWNFSLVAIAVGYVVGGAVRSGSGDRGGRFYQFFAVFLMYSSLIGMFIPQTWRALGSTRRGGKEIKKAIEHGARAEAKTDSAQKADGSLAENVVEVKADARPAAVAPGPPLAAEAKARPATSDGKNRVEVDRAEPRPRGVVRLLYLLSMLFLYCVLFVGLIYFIPVVVAIHSPISLFIFGVGLWQAWKMNRADEVVVTGPYRVRG